MLSLIRKRLLFAIPTLFAVSFITFILGYLAPGNPIDTMYGEKISPQERQRLLHEFGFDRPALVQYGDFLGRAVRGDLGKSFSTEQRPITELIADKFPNTAFLACMALVTAMLLGLPAGLLAALKHNGFLDRAAMSLVLLLISVPAFVLAPLLVLLFSVKLQWLNDSGWDTPADYLLPVLVLAARPAALLARFMRSSMLEVIRQDYIRTAFAKGLSPGRVLLKHALKNAFLPVLTVLGTTFGYLLSGSFVVEVYFRIPGIGYESVEAIKRRDYPLIQGVALLVAVIFIVVNLVVDVLYGAVDPRVRYEEAR